MTIKSLSKILLDVWQKLWARRRKREEFPKLRDYLKLNEWLKTCPKIPFKDSHEWAASCTVHTRTHRHKRTLTRTHVTQHINNWRTKEDTYKNIKHGKCWARNKSQGRTNVGRDSQTDGHSLDTIYGKTRLRNAESKRCVAVVPQPDKTTTKPPETTRITHSIQEPLTHTHAYTRAGIRIYTPTEVLNITKVRHEELHVSS